MKNQVLICVVLTVVVIGSLGCENQSAKINTAPKSTTDFVDTSITQFQNLGWVGVLTHPVSQSFSFENPHDPESTVSPGGLVVREISKESAAEQAGLKVGDVIVGVGEDWVPIKDDPTLDVVKLIELQVAASKANTELKVYREGKCQSLSLVNTTKSLEDGSPEKVARMSDGAKSGLGYLAGLQNKDGSFSEDGASVESKLRLASIAGLAFLSSGDENFAPNAELCKTFIGKQLDSLANASKPDGSKATEAVEKSAAPKSGVMVMQKMPAIELDPLAAAYVLQFLAESDVAMMDQKWMPQLFGLIGAVGESQDESGGWSVSQSDNEEEGGDSAVDVDGTHATNQVLLALGMIERKGMMGSPETISKACGFLKDQIASRAGSNLDRRTKAALMAGTAAALVSINCQKSDSVLKDAFSDGLEKLSERHAAPQFALPGVLSAAILARHAGADSWAQFHTDTKYWLSSVQLPDGSFNCSGGEFEQKVWETAHYCLLYSMQSTSLDKLIGKSDSPMMVARNSSGEKTEGSKKSETALPAGIPAGAQVLQLDLGDLDGGDIQEAIKKKLKEQGIDLGDAEISGLDGLEDKKK